MKSQDQSGYGGFSASCAPDDGRGFSPSAGEADVLQGVFLCIRKPEIYVFKAEYLLGVIPVPFDAVFSVLNFRLCFQHFLHTADADSGPG